MPLTNKTNLSWWISENLAYVGILKQAQMFNYPTLQLMPSFSAYSRLGFWPITAVFVSVVGFPYYCNSKGCI